MKSAIIILFAVVTVSLAQEGSPQPPCRYSLTVSGDGARIRESYGKSGATCRSVEELKQYIETIAPGCTIRVWFEVSRSKFWDAYPELKTLCEARQIKLVRLIE